MFIEPDNKDVSGLAHGDAQFEPDGKGRYNVPTDVAAAVTSRPGWTVSEDQSTDEPAPKEPVKAPAKPRTKKPAE